MMNPIHNNWRIHRNAHGLRPVGTRSAFTLVEMLVSVALVVIMMAMFASVFQLAAGSVGTQQGIAENDQRARSVTIVLENDLKSRSAKIALPFTAGEVEPDPDDADYSVRLFDQRRGYFYISENDIDNDADDVLQFTVLLDGTDRDYYGRAALLEGLGNPQFLSSNQPSRDDADSNPNDNSSNSIAAEISYFLRGGRLYRRVMLIRDPLEESDPVQPENSNGVDYFDPNNDGTMGTPPLYAGNFWNEFDFSAHSTMQFDMSGMVTANTGAKFHGLDDLNNDGGTGLFPLANPRFRFGHNHEVGSGQPREYIGAQFIGRFTHEETSHSAFQYPQWESTVGVPGNPMDAALVLNDADGNDVIDEFETAPRGQRRAEDLLLANVHAFDVKVLDEKLGRFVDIGHQEFVDVGGDGNFDSGTDYYVGDFNQNLYNRRQSATSYGSNNSRIFDTWHPGATVSGNGNSPFRPMQVYPSPLGSTPMWAADTDYVVGDVVFPTSSTDHRFAYRAIRDGRSNLTEPAWPTGKGDTVDDGATPATAVRWRLISNIRPLKAVLITIRYLDVSSNQLRQLSLQVALTPDN